MKVIIVTGSSGLIGSESVKFFIKKGFKVLGIDNNLKGFFGKDGDTKWQLNNLKKLKIIIILIMILEIIKKLKIYLKNLEKN